MRALAVAVVVFCSTASAQPQPAFPDEPVTEAAAQPTPSRPPLSEPPPPPQLVWPKPQPPAEVGPSVLEGIHGYAGLTAGFGLALFEGFSAPLAVRGGVWLGKLDLSLELAPKSDLVVGLGGISTLFQLSAAVGYLLALSEKPDFALGWPFRLSAGFYSYFGLGARLSLNLFGLGFRIGQFHFELSVPATLYLAPRQRPVIALPLTLALSRLF